MQSNHKKASTSMRVEVQLGEEYQELVQHLESFPLRSRAKRLKVIAMMGLEALNRSQSGQNFTPLHPNTPSPSPEPKGKISKKLIQSFSASMDQG